MLFTNLFYLLRPIIDVLGTITLIAVCVAALVYAILIFIKKTWKYLLAIGFIVLALFLFCLVA